MRVPTITSRVRRGGRKCRAPIVTAAILAGAVIVSCTSPRTMLTQLVEARSAAAELHVRFTQAADASNRAVMADTDASAAAAAGEARTARGSVERQADSLNRLLQSLGYGDDLLALGRVRACFQEYRQLDDEILPLSVENTNVKAQRLSFGPAQEAADAFRRSLEAAVSTRIAGEAWHSQALASQAIGAVLRVQVLQAPHIAEADLAAMMQMEEEMSKLETDARSIIAELRHALPASAAPHLSAATGALDRFTTINKELIALSRRNSDVRSLALSLGRKRTVTAQCEADLKSLDEILNRHAFTATR
jgi:hypothetical protein